MWVDDAPAGRIPVTVVLPRCDAAVRIAVRRPYFDVWQRAVTLRAGESRTLAVSLARPTMWVTVESSPPGASVPVNGKPQGETPLRVPVTAYRRATVELGKPGYRTSRTSFVPKLEGRAVRATLETARSTS